MNRIKYYYKYRIDGFINVLFIIFIVGIIIYIIFNIKIISNDLFIKGLLKDSNNYISLGSSKPSIIDLIKSIELPFYNNDRVFNYYGDYDEV